MARFPYGKPPIEKPLPVVEPVVVQAPKVEGESERDERLAKEKKNG